MRKWRTISLGDVCVTNRGSYSKNDNWEYVNYLDTGNITQNRIDSIQTIDLSQEKLPSRAKRKVQHNDILFSIVRPNQLHYGIIKEQPDNFLVSTGFAVISAKPEKIDADYLYFYLTQNRVVDGLHAIAEQSTSAYPSIKPSDIEKLMLQLPSLDTQKKTAAVLMSIEQKMVFNDAINENLEQQAQNLFNDMFVTNNSAEWIQGSLSDIAIITMGQSPSGRSYNENGEGMVFFQGRTDFGSRFPTRRLYTTEPKRIAEENDILMSVRAPVGDFNIAHEKCCIGRGLGSIKSKDKHPSFILYTMFSLQSQLNVFNGEGTVFGSINRDALNFMPINIPPVEEMDKFENIVASMDAMIRNNYEEICRLQKLRDNLLPKLMSGEIDVSNVTI